MSTQPPEQNDGERRDPGSNPNSTNWVELIQDQRNESLANIEIVVLSVILILAIAGNGLMLIALRRQLKFRPISRMYFFMLNLSVTDLLVAFGNILPQLAWDITFRFKGTDFLCRIIKFLQIFVLYLSSYVLASMAVDRYMVICHQSFTRNHYNGLKVPKLMIIISWILSFVFASPQAFIFSLSEIKPGVIDCWTFLSPSGAKAYVTWFVGSVFVLPLLLVGLSYGAICLKVVSFSLPSSDNGDNGRKLTGGGFKSKSNSNGYGRYSKKASSFSSSSMKTESETRDSTSSPLQKDVSYRALKRQISQAKVKALKLTLVVVICFFVCWAPFCIAQLLMVYHPSMPVGPINVILLLLASLNSCTNPWIYLAFSETLCNQLRIFLGIGLRRGSNEESIGDEQDLPRRPVPNETNKKSSKMVEHQNKSLPLKRAPSFGDQDIQDDVQIPPETKSEVF